MKRLALVVLLTLTAAVLVWGYTSNPPNGTTGAPGESLCSTDCHSTYPENSGNGSLTISSFPSFPSSYDPLTTYTLDVTISDPGQRGWGFEVAVKDSNNLQAGTLTIVDGVNTRSGVENGITYIKQTLAGSHPEITEWPVTWSFNWTAPASGTGKVYFYVSGIAANYGTGPLGDYGYHISQQVPEKTTGVGEESNGYGSVKPDRFDLHQNYPNPFNLATSISYTLKTEGMVNLTIYNILGQKIRTLIDQKEPAGNYSVQWDGRDEKGRVVAGGVYFYVLKAGDFTSSKRMVLLK